MLNNYYVAGYVDGEGTIGIARHQARPGGKHDGWEFKPFFCIHSTDHSVIRRCKEYFDEKGIPVSYGDRNQHYRGKGEKAVASRVSVKSWEGVYRICKLLKKKVIGLTSLK